MTIKGRETRELTSISYWKLSGIVMFLLALSFLYVNNAICFVNASGDIKILEVVPCDMLGNPKYSFEIGKIACFKVSIDYSGAITENVLLSANVYDSTGVAQGIVWSNITLSSGASTFILNLAIPKSAHIGQALVYVNVYNDLPRNAGFPLCPESSATFQLFILGDVSGPIPYVPDGKVNVMDIVAILSKYATTPSSPNWNPNMDLNKDGVVNMRDLNIVLMNITP
jgi:hypothetical protein